MKQYDIFNEGIEKETNVFKIMNWISRCRTHVSSNSNLTPDEYIQEVRDFTSAWKKHYQENKTFYKSEFYRKALVFNGKEKNKFYILIGNEKIDISSVFHFGLLEEYNNKLIEKFNQHQIDEYYEYWNLIQDLENLKPEEKETSSISIQETIFNIAVNSKKYYSINYYLTEQDDDSEEITSKTENKAFPVDKSKLKDLLKAIKEKDYFNMSEILNDIALPFDFEPDDLIKKFEVKDFEDDPIAMKKAKSKENTEYYIYDGYKINKTDLQEMLTEYDITKQVWYNYYNDTETVTQKNFFYNMGFFLSLDIDSMEVFLKLHGYSLLKSWDKRDLIITDAISIGYDYSYVLALGKYLDDQSYANRYENAIKEGKGKENEVERIKYYFIGKKEYDNRSVKTYLENIYIYEKEKGSPDCSINEDLYKQSLERAIKKINDSIKKYQDSYAKNIERFNSKIIRAKDQYDKRVQKQLKAKELLEAQIERYKKTERMHLVESNQKQIKDIEDKIDDLGAEVEAEIKSIRIDKAAYEKDNIIVPYNKIFNKIPPVGDLAKEQKSLKDWQALRDSYQEKLKKLSSK